VVQGGFSMLCDPFQTSQGQFYSAYVAFYQVLATAIRQVGLKLIVANDAMRS
jgi:hypothetical protein